MKRFTVAVIIIAALTAVVFAIGKFNRRTTASSSILGNWKLDSFYAPTTSSYFAHWLLDSVERNATFLRFLPDSTLILFAHKDSSTEKYYLNDSTLYIRSGNEYEQRLVRQKADDRIELVGTKDSITLVLKRLP